MSRRIWIAEGFASDGDIYVDRFIGELADLGWIAFHGDEVANC